MWLLAEITLGIVPGVSARYLALIIRVSVVLLLAIVMVFFWLCFWLAIRTVYWIGRPDRWWNSEAHTPSAG